MMEAARNNARTKPANESDLLYKVKGIHITTKIYLQKYQPLKETTNMYKYLQLRKETKEKLNKSTQEKGDASDAKRKKWTKPILPYLNL